MRAAVQGFVKYLPRRYTRWMWKTVVALLVVTAVVAIHSRRSVRKHENFSHRSEKSNRDDGDSYDDDVPPGKSSKLQRLESEWKLSGTQDTIKKASDTEPLKILVNGEYTVDGLLRREDSEPFLPFSFVRKYFDVYGALKSSPEEGSTLLNFSQSYGQPHLPSPGTRHRANGPFMSFGTFNVESRERVLCIDEFGVPLSIQWDPKGFHFATQISQFGLQHYSAWFLEKTRKSNKTSTLVESGTKFSNNFWRYRTKAGAFVKVTNSPFLRRRVLKFCTEVPDSDLLSVDGITRVVSSQQPGEVVAMVTFQASGPLVLSFRVQASNKHWYVLHYDSTAKEAVTLRAESIRYRLRAPLNKWTTIARNLRIDLQRGLMVGKRKGAKKKDPTKSLKITTVEALILRGCGELANFSLTTSAHKHMALDAADWLVANQDQHGGWPVSVTRTLKPDLILKPGWYSAMAQGQAMSLLVRAYYATKSQVYLQSAKKATTPFHVLSAKGGVRAKFMNNFIWYEEYPTVPSSFVLNGFIYALLGLYDLSMVEGETSEAAKLYNDGLRSLKAMAGLYDTGSGTLYDLRHAAVLIEPNRARWDYHVTHINLMGTMATIDDDPLFPTLQERWLGYMKGHRSKHN